MLRSAVESVLAQIYADWELIIVDDASPAPLPTFTDHRIQVIKNLTNRGKAASVNHALNIASGKVVAFLDDDDGWTPYRLSHAHMEHERGIDVVVCGSMEMRVLAETSLRGRWRRLFRDQLSSHLDPRSDTGGIGSMNCDSVVKELCPDFDESFIACEDSDWAIRLWQTTQSVAIINPKDFIWRNHQGYRHNNGVNARIVGTKMLLEKHQKYYSEHPDAESFRLYRLAILCWSVGDAAATRKYAFASLRVRPNLRAAKWCMRAVVAINRSRRRDKAEQELWARHHG